MAQHSGTLAYARQKEIEDQVRSGAIYNATKSTYGL